MIRIFHFPFANANSGVKHYVMNNWNNINKDKFYFEFATVRKQLEFEDEIIQSGAGVKHISCTAENDRNLFIEEFSEILYGNYDVVHLHTSFWKSFLVEQIAVDCKIPKIIVHSHSTRVDIEDEHIREEAEKIHNIRKTEFNTSLATDFCACSNAAADWLFGLQIPRDKIKIMKNAIDVDKFIYNKNVRDKYRAELGLDGCFVIGNVGRMAYQKNQKFLLDMLSQVLNIIPNARLLIVGDGPLKSELEMQAEELDIADKVIFTGIRNDVNNLMQAMDIFCLPSQFEGLPIVLVEAQASGLKCLGSDKITDEVCVTDSIKLVPLQIEKWIDSMIEIFKGYQRNNMHDAITNSGYNIKYQIKEIEKLYLS